MFSSICARINGWVNTGEAGDLRRHRAYYDVILICYSSLKKLWIIYLLEHTQFQYQGIYGLTEKGSVNII